MDEFQKEMFDVFVFETNSFLEQLETILMQAETQDGSILDAVPEIFRIMHTIKSSSAMMGFPNVSKLAHSMEDLFYYIRENKPGHVDKKKLTDIVLFGVDYIKRNMAVPDAEEDSTSAIGEVAAYLRVLSGGPEETFASETAPEAALAGGAACQVRVTFKPNCVMIGLRAFEIIHKASLIQQDVTASPDEDDPEAETILQAQGLLLSFPSTDRMDEILAQIKASPFVLDAAVTGAQEAASAPVEAASAPLFAKTPGAETTPVPAKAAELPHPEQAATRVSTSSYMGIEVQKLDALIDLAGEMIISSMGATHAFDLGDEERTKVAMEDLHHLILEMQDRVLSLRMVAVKDMFHKLNRSVRDAAGKLGKAVDFSMSGEDTALDRNVIDQVFSPLMHILRNSVDHGLESPQEREMLDKPAVGKISLSAAIEGDLAILRVTDDGKGIDRSLVLEKAIRSGLIAKDQAQTMADEDVFALLFLPGFSTKETVSELSGRGVGMDVVHESVRKLNGRVTIASSLGQGTQIDLRIPLSLAILDAMIVRVGEEVCAIPTSAIREAFQPDADSIRQANGQDVVLHQGICHQIIRLSDLFGMQAPSYTDGLMLVLDAHGESFALFISDVRQQQNIVVKPIPPLLKGIRGIYGCTILGDGKVCLIMDVDGLLHRKGKR